VRLKHIKPYILEACVDSVESAINACRGGANRLELCSNLIIGGTTPSKYLFLAVKKYCDIKIHVLIRPRFGDFYYSEYELDIMKDEITMFRELGADGIVIGILNADGSLDQKRMSELIRCAGDMSITLHRAYDVCIDPFKTMEQAIDLGVQSILTSGQENHCLSGKGLLCELVQKASNKIDVMVGGGVNAEVIMELFPSTHATSYHMSGKRVKESGMIYRKDKVNMGLPSFSEYDIWQTEERIIQKAKDTLVSLCSMNTMQ
jgi:copper homeostasis protein